MWAGVFAVLPVVLMQLGAILIAGVLLYFRYGRAEVLYLAAIVAVPLRLLASSEAASSGPQSMARGACWPGSPGRAASPAAAAEGTGRARRLRPCGPTPMCRA